MLRSVHQVATITDVSSASSLAQSQLWSCAGRLTPRLRCLPLAGKGSAATAALCRDASAAFPRFSSPERGMANEIHSTE